MQAVDATVDRYAGQLEEARAQEERQDAMLAASPFPIVFD